jgi:hypothetical protein
VFSALATVAVAADAFYDPRNLWIMEVGHLSRVRSLDRRLVAGHHVAAGQGRTPRPFPRSKAGRPARPPARVRPRGRLAPPARSGCACPAARTRPR